VSKTRDAVPETRRSRGTSAKSQTGGIVTQLYARLGNEAVTREAGWLAIKTSEGGR